MLLAPLVRIRPLRVRLVGQATRDRLAILALLVLIRQSRDQRDQQAGRGTQDLRVLTRLLLDRLVPLDIPATLALLALTQLLLDRLDRLVGLVRPDRLALIRP